MPIFALQNMTFGSSPKNLSENVAASFIFGVRLLKTLWTGCAGIGAAVRTRPRCGGEHTCGIAQIWSGSRDPVPVLCPARRQQGTPLKGLSVGFQSDARCASDLQRRHVKGATNHVRGGDRRGRVGLRYHNEFYSSGHPDWFVSHVKLKNLPFCGAEIRFSVQRGQDWGIGNLVLKRLKSNSHCQWHVQGTALGTHNCLNQKKCQSFFCD